MEQPYGEEGGRDGGDERRKWWYVLEGKTFEKFDKESVGPFGGEKQRVAIARALMSDPFPPFFRPFISVGERG